MEIVTNKIFKNKNEERIKEMSDQSDFAFSTSRMILIEIVNFTS